MASDWTDMVIELRLRKTKALGVKKRVAGWRERRGRGKGIFVNKLY